MVLFGTEPRIKQRSNTFPLEVLKCMESEELLHAAYSHDASNNTNVHVTNISQSNLQDILTDDRNIGIQSKRARGGLVVQSEGMVQRSRLEQVAGDS